MSTSAVVGFFLSFVVPFAVVLGVLWLLALYLGIMRRRDEKNEEKEAKQFEAGPFLPVSPSPSLPDNSMRGKIQHNICPDCGKGGEGEFYQFLMGAHAGIAMNIKCKDCGSLFSVAPLDDEARLWEIFFASRVGEKSPNLSAQTKPAAGGTDATPKQ